MTGIASEVLKDFEVHACTDVTGFGLIGHALEMASASQVTLKINPGAIPVLPGAAEYAQMGLVPAGAYRNRDYAGNQVKAENVPDFKMDILFDPQTSGGLLASVPEDMAPDIIRRMRSAGLPTRCAVIGRVLPGRDYSILVSS